MIAKGENDPTDTASQTENRFFTIAGYESTAPLSDGSVAVRGEIHLVNPSTEPETLKDFEELVAEKKVVEVVVPIVNTADPRVYASLIEQGWTPPHE